MGPGPRTLPPGSCTGVVQMRLTNTSFQGTNTAVYEVKKFYNIDTRPGFFSCRCYLPGCPRYNRQIASLENIYLTFKMLRYLWGQFFSQMTILILRQYLFINVMRKADISIVLVSLGHYQLVTNRELEKFLMGCNVKIIVPQSVWPFHS